MGRKKTSSVLLVDPRTSTMFTCLHMNIGGVRGLEDHTTFLAERALFVLLLLLHVCRDPYRI